MAMKTSAGEHLARCIAEHDRRHTLTTTDVTGDTTRRGQHARRVDRVNAAPTLVLAVAYREPLIHVEPAWAWDLLDEDEERWRAWTAEIDGSLPFQEEVIRSLLTIRLLTYSPSRAPVAAPTTSLPEDPGGGRNWDYRYAGNLHPPGPSLVGPGHTVTFSAP
ncbi:hypothetical protein AB0J14_28465 [Micromonospora arborensis]|uniref:hypothetical protein n=1 Tax=Micromonospora arborensis TaxID=2116518 RepID=UPI0033F1261C